LASVLEDRALQTCGASGNCDQVVLLQKSLLHAGIHQASSENPCVHGYLRGKHISICYPGWAGVHCDCPEEALEYDPSASIKGFVDDEQGMTCGLPIFFFPYIDAPLWGRTLPAWAACDGRSQSPINLITQRHGQRGHIAPRLNASYGRPVSPSERSLGVTNDGHGIHVEGHYGFVIIDGVKYESQNFHFHRPSEHLVDGKAAELEMHIVHTAHEADNGTNTSLAVVSILFDLGEENACLKEVFSAPMPMAGCRKDIQPFVLGHFFNEQLEGPWWSYEGSLTTPPCTEGVRWNVLTKRATISREQLKLHTTRYINNARPKQAHNDTRVSWHKVS